VAFGLPIILAVVLYNYSDTMRRPTVNYGELVLPARPLKDFTLQRLDREGVINLGDLERFWTLVYVDSSECDERCKQNLYKVRQCRLAMGGEKERVKRLMVLTDTSHWQALSRHLEQHRGMMVGSAAGQPLEQFLRQLELENSASPATAQRIYLVDPLGNLMMSYPADAEPKGIVKDMERLLKVSQLG
jgi:hypothetical protein